MNTANSDSRGLILRFGPFELDTEAEQLLKGGRTVRLQPQPFKLLHLLATMPGKVVTREQIQSALWTGDTFVDFDQGVNFAVKQVREALGEDAERPIYIQTVPRRGYRFLAPVEAVTPGVAGVPPVRTDLKLHKALWENIAELRLIEEERRVERVERHKTIRVVALVLAVLGMAALAAAAVLLIKAR